MIGYVTLGTNDLPRAAAFYDKIAGALGVSRMMENDSFIAWGTPGGGAGIGPESSNQTDVDRHVQGKGFSERLRLLLVARGDHERGRERPGGSPGARVWGVPVAITLGAVLPLGGDAALEKRAARGFPIVIPRQGRGGARHGQEPALSAREKPRRPLLREVHQKRVVARFERSEHRLHGLEERAGLRFGQRSDEQQPSPRRTHLVRSRCDP